MPDSSVVVEGVVLLCFPPVDEVFCATARHVLASLDGAQPADLEAALRPVYPQVVVRPRDELASYDGERAWYVYRDGRYTVPADPVAPGTTEGPPSD